MRRILDGRPFLVLPDDGLSLITFGYVDNLAHALLLAVDQPEASMGEIFNCGDDERLTIRQVAEIITDELHHDWELHRRCPPTSRCPPAPDDGNYRTAAPGGRHLQAARAGSATATSCPPGRPCAVPRSGWSRTRRARRLRGVRAAGPLRLRRRGQARGVVAKAAIADPPTSATSRSSRATASPTPVPAPATSDPTPASDPETTTMTLQGWSLPLSPGGTASLVPPPPWHFSGEALGIDFRAVRRRHRGRAARGPRARRRRLLLVHVLRVVVVRRRRPPLIADPARGQYREAYVSVSASMDGRKVTRVPYIRVDNACPWPGATPRASRRSSARCTSAGRCGSGRADPGSSRGCSWATRRASATRSCTVPSPSPTRPRRATSPGRCVPVWHTRHFPDLAGGDPLVHDLARNLISGFELADIWQGDAELDFLPSEFEEHMTLAPIEVLSGFSGAVAFTITGAEVRS